jgi:pentatricopeptide repeat protein
LIRGLCLDGKLPQALNFFNADVRKGFHPDIFNYGTLIDGLCKIGDAHYALVLLQHMDKVGKCQAGIVENNTIIDSVCKTNQVDKAMEMFSCMIHKGITPNVVTYTTLIHGVCSIGRFKKGERLLTEMINKNISPNVRTFSISPNSLMDGYCLDGEVG